MSSSISIILLSKFVDVKPATARWGMLFNRFYPNQALRRPLPSPIASIATLDRLLQLKQVWKDLSSQNLKLLKVTLPQRRTWIQVEYPSRHHRPLQRRTRLCRSLHLRRQRLLYSENKWPLIGQANTPRARKTPGEACLTLIPTTTIRHLASILNTRTPYPFLLKTPRSNTLRGLPRTAWRRRHSGWKLAACHQWGSRWACELSVNGVLP